MTWESDPEGRMLALILWVFLALAGSMMSMAGPVWLFLVVVALGLAGFLALVLVP